MPLFRSPLAWIVIALLLVGVFLVLRKRRQGGDWGFKDILRNPARWEDMASASDAADREAEAAKSWDDATLAEAVRAFVFDAETARKAWVQARVLRNLGTRTHPPLLALLEDRSLAARWMKPTGVDLLPETPFERACDLLRDDPPVGAIPLLVPFLANPDKSVRQHAAHILAETGAATALPHVRTALQDADEYVRSYALMGLSSAAEESRLAPDVAAEIFSDVARVLGERMNARDAAKLLYQLDRKRAHEVLSSVECLAAQHPALDQILGVLADEKARVERGRLLALVDALTSGPSENQQPYAIGAVLRLLGYQRDPRDLERLQAGVDHANHRISDDAASGLLAFHGLEDYAERIQTAYVNDQQDALTEQQRWCQAVFMCNSEVCNGGLSQYFFNSSGDHWPQASMDWKQSDPRNSSRCYNRRSPCSGRPVHPPTDGCDRIN